MDCNGNKKKDIAFSRYKIFETKNKAKLLQKP
jgi:hypothetical protein